MADHADVVIIGGGAVGAATAYHLAARGVTNVVLVEREVLAAGSTSKAAGGIRLQFGDELNVRIMQRSLPAFERFDAELDAAIGFHQSGYLFLLDDAADMARFEQAVALQQRLGVPSRMIGADEALALVPGLEGADLIGASYCPLDGYATPESVVQGYAAAAGRMGVRIRQSCEVTGIDTRGYDIVAVETTKGRIETDCVVCAAGVASRAIGAMVGVEVPVERDPHWLHWTAERGDLAADMPLVVDFGSGFYVHPEGTGLLFGGRERSLDALAGVAIGRLPVLAELAVHASWWGDFELSPDHNAIVGEVDGVSRFLYATGFSGHGFMQSPAIGEHLAELTTGVEPTLDLKPLSADRFREPGRHRPEALIFGL
ncbi:MAG: hypothetical protein V7607_4506 [Solirubrobacteraceae bacterium]